MKVYGKNYKFYLFIPAILFIFFLFVVLVSPGIEQGIDLKGGTLIIIRAEKAVDAKKLESILNAKFRMADLKVNSISSPVGFGVTIQFAENKDLSSASAEIVKAKDFLSKNDSANAIASSKNAASFLSPFLKEGIPDRLSAKDSVEKADELYSKARDSFHNSIREEVKNNFGLKEGFFFQLREIGPQLGKAFWDNVVKVALIAFIGIIVVVFVFFREFVPSSLIIFSAVFDALVALAGMALFKIPLSLNSIPALLMLVGYSVDTDILLTTRMLKRKEGTPRDRAMGSISTGVTMTLTTLAAVTVMLVVSYLNQIIVINEIATVLFFGLIGDLIGTWLFNAPALLWYVEKKKSVSK